MGIEWELVAEKLGNLKRRCRRWGQRRIWGWDETEIWSLDWSLAKLILPRLEYFRANLNGWPGTFGDDETVGLKEWEGILDKMLLAFRLVASPKVNFGSEQEAQIEEGLELFGKYMRSLWT